MSVATSFPVGRHHDVLEQLGDGEPSTQLEAEAFIEDIRNKKGYLDLDTMQQVQAMQTRYRDNILRVIEQLKDTEASYTRSISEQLYSSRYRFLYELIQNADDSLYRNALNKGFAAVLKFRITPQKFVIETNEDGFTRKNVEAICATGKSSKKATATDDHIGEKGFGFKSVFSVADEVRIQSGVWSFRFEHCRGDNGLGMVTPLNAPMEALEKGITTRITLRLAKDTKEDYQELVDAVADLPKTIICFLRKLRVIRIYTTHLDARTEITSILKIAEKSERLLTIKQSRRCDSTFKVDTSVYHTTTHTVNDMPQDDRRKGQQSVKIDLAFPINHITKQPKQCDLGQHVFAYLPLQRLPQIQFLIQSDFITSANRESVIDCAWNAAICDGVAKTFTMAVERFATADHSLRYSWLDYLPTKPMEHPWKRLYPSIKKMLELMPVLQTWEQRGFKSAHGLRRFSYYHLYKDEPILSDLPENCYIAPEYDTRHDQTLEDLGVHQLSDRELIAQIQTDLHEAFAKLGLLTLQRAEALYCQPILKRQTVIPLLKPNQWTGAPGVNPGGLDKIYFPYTGTTQIPGDIGLHMVDRVASTNTARKAFYKALGVVECPKETVFAKIREIHVSMRGPSELYSHLTYLFRFHDRPEELQCWLQMPTDDGRKRPVSGTFYFPSSEDYDIDQLLPKDIRSQINLELNIFPRSLADLEPSTLVVHGRTWKAWLKEVTNAQYHPFLCRPRKNSPSLSLSLAFKAVLEHNPKKFLGTLKAHWSKYQHHAPKVCDDLRECKVPCRSGESLPLHTTYLPTIKILEKLQRLSIDSFNPRSSILTLPDGDLDDFTCRQWQFLEDYGVCSKPDLRFYQLTLELLSDISDVSLEVMKELYTSMAGLVTMEDQESLREFFGNNLCIWHSKNGWVSIDDCVWEGPDFFRYTAMLESQYPKDDRLKNFFVTTLGIGNWDISIFLDDFKFWTVDEKHSLDFSLAGEIYAYLETNVSKDADWSELRKGFKNDTLVLGEHDTWYKLDRCVWKSPFPLAGYQDLHTIYPNLEDFFTKRMKIKKVRPSLLINEVKQMAEQNQPRIDDIRLRLINIGMILAKNDIDADIEEALNTLKTVTFLPKRLIDGKLVLVSMQDDFVIPDHARYGKTLESHGVALDFKIDETQILDAIFQYLGLTSRYLSVAVVEESTVEDEVRVDQALSRQLQNKAYALYW